MRLTSFRRGAVCSPCKWHPRVSGRQKNLACWEWDEQAGVFKTGQSWPVNLPGRVLVSKHALGLLLRLQKQMMGEVQCGLSGKGLQVNQHSARPDHARWSAPAGLHNRPVALCSGDQGILTRSWASLPPGGHTWYDTLSEPG